MQIRNFSNPFFLIRTHPNSCFQIQGEKQQTTLLPHYKQDSSLGNYFNDVLIQTYIAKRIEAVAWACSIKNAPKEVFYRSNPGDCFWPLQINTYFNTRKKILLRLLGNLFLVKLVGKKKLKEFMFQF